MFSTFDVKMVNVVENAECFYNYVCAGFPVLWCRYLVLVDKQPKKNFIKQNMQSKMKWSSLSVYQFLLADVGLGAKSKSSGQIIRNRSNISNCNTWGFAVLYIVSSRYLLSPSPGYKCILQLDSRGQLVLEWRGLTILRSPVMIFWNVAIIQIGCNLGLNCPTARSKSSAEILRPADSALNSNEEP